MLAAVVCALLTLPANTEAPNGMMEKAAILIKLYQKSELLKTISIALLKPLKTAKILLLTVKSSR